MMNKLKIAAILITSKPLSVQILLNEKNLVDSIVETTNTIKTMWKPNLEKRWGLEVVDFKITLIPPKDDKPYSLLSTYRLFGDERNVNIACNIDDAQKNLTDEERLRFRVNLSDAEYKQSVLEGLERNFKE